MCESISEPAISFIYLLHQYYSFDYCSCIITEIQQHQCSNFMLYQNCFGWSRYSLFPHEFLKSVCPSLHLVKFIAKNFTRNENSYLHRNRYAKVRSNFGNNHQNQKNPNVFQEVNGQTICGTPIKWNTAMNGKELLHTQQYR